MSDQETKINSIEERLTERLIKIERDLNNIFNYIEYITGYMISDKEIYTKETLIRINEALSQKRSDNFKKTRITKKKKKK